MRRFSLYAGLLLLSAAIEFALLAAGEKLYADPPVVTGARR